jgi:hypothetical protein
MRGLVGLVLASMLGLLGCPPGKPCRLGEVEDLESCCADREPDENNCQACSSQPSCGWCETPRSGPARCMARPEGDAAPEACASGWAPSTAGCPGPTQVPPGGIQ